MYRSPLIVLILCGVMVFHVGESARILGIFPAASISHQVVFRGLTLALQERGHELVVLTTDPIRDPNLKNYTEIDFSFLYDEVTRYNINHVEVRSEMEWLDFFRMILKSMRIDIKNMLNHPEILRFCDPNDREKFDLVIMEYLIWEAFYPIIKCLDAPWIGIASLGLGSITEYAQGIPIMPSHPSNYDIRYNPDENLTFWKRLQNFYKEWSHVYEYRTEHRSAMETIAREVFGDYGSTIAEIEKNVSLIFVNQQSPISWLKPTLPKVIEIGGFHVAKKTKPLPKELKQFLDEAEAGFVYMSLGSNAKSTMLSNKTRQAFIDAFSKLPYRVLWKYEEDAPPGMPKNVFTMKWIPQQSVLAHPNIKVFVYQGGLQSTEEAIYHAVPLVGFPVLGDQDSQVGKMVSIGVCKRFEINDFKADQLAEAIVTIAKDNRYKEEMLNLKRLVEDRPYDPLDNAVWWTEHVIRHKGIRYLDSSTADLVWYQRGDIDLVAFITAACLIASIIIVVLSFRIITYVIRIDFVSNKEKIH